MWFDSIWRVFVSVRLTITLLVALALLCVAGTLIAQQGATQVPIEKLYSAATLAWLVRLGLTDIFHGAPFVGFLLMLAVNLVACSIERLPGVWREAFLVAPPPLDERALGEWSQTDARRRKTLVERPEACAVRGVREARMAAQLFLQKRFGRYVVVRDAEDGFQAMVEQGKYSRLGVYITHLSLLMIMTGGVVGAIFGFEGATSIEEGTRVAWIQHLKGSSGGMELIRENGAPVKGFLNLGFEVECERFALETYDGQRPKAFRSLLHFYENDVRVHSAEIAVNHPTVFKGMTFYQASYSEAGPGGVGLKIFRMAEGGRGRRAAREPSSEATPTAGGVAPSLLPMGKLPPVESVELVENVRLGELYRVDGDAAFRVLAVEPNLMELGPAARVQYYPTRQAKTAREFWVFQALPGFDFAHRKGSRLHFVLESLRPKYATGLSVARDPGVWIVWIGSLILVAALFLALYTCHRRYWVAFTPSSGFVVAGWSNKLFLFEPRFERLYGSFREEFK